MGLTRTTSGKIFHEDGSSLDKWDVSAAGVSTISVATGNFVMTCHTDGSGNECSMVYEDYLPETGIWVVRTQVKNTDANSTRYNGIGITSNDTQPTAVSRDMWDNETEPTIHFSAWATTTKYVAWFPNATTMDAVNFPATTFAVNTYYAWEIESVGTGSQSHKARSFTEDFASLVVTATKTATRGQNKCWVWFSGNTNSYCHFGELTIEFLQAMVSLDITVTGLSSGQAIRIYTRDGTVLASAVESGGTATLDMRGVEGFDTNSNPATADGGFDGKIKIFRDNTYTEPVHLYSFNDIWGGDEYEYEADDFLPEAISSPDAMPIPESSESVVRDTPIFAGGLPVISSYTVEE